jgi:maltose O-acetyltransferase
MFISGLFKALYRKSQVRRGLTLGRNVYISTSAIIDHEFCWLVTIGDDSIIAHNAIILCHDASSAKLTGLHKIGKVNIGSRAFIGASTVILPGVSIGNDVIVGAGSVVTNDIPDNCIAAGNPARVIESMPEFIEKFKNRQVNIKVLNLKQQTLQSMETKRKIKNALTDNKICYLSLY